jgi:hypothetical protein
VEDGHLVAGGAVALVDADGGEGRGIDGRNWRKSEIDCVGNKSTMT